MAFALTPVTGSGFIGRKALVSELVTELSSRNKIGFSLSGARRIGKTSLLREVQRQLGSQGIPVVYLSLWNVSPKTVDQFVRTLNHASVAAFENFLSAKFRFEELLTAGASAFGRLLQNLKLSAGVGKDLEVSVRYVRGDTQDVGAALTKSFSLVEDMARMTRKRPVLMLDEFPSLSDLTHGSKNQKIGESAIKLARTIYEEFEQTKLVISGAYRATLENVVMKRRSPFYRQLLQREINPFDRQEYTKFLKHYLPKVQFGEDSLERLYEITSGIPYNLQLLARQTHYENVARLDIKELHRISDNLLREDGEMLFREYVNDLQPSAVKVLHTLARNPKTPPGKIASVQFMQGRTVASSLTLLQREGLVRRVGRGNYEFRDNLFAEWLCAKEQH